ncbi:WD40-repeat-containing domain protein [Myxozyma melibiosi]|uniref:WD40-repeat-containing domain protein n=1 Tax=Myxozyma melibiosi TaxID=54550 RepID=A0ABR1F0E2_9ASCO
MPMRIEPAAHFQNGNSHPKHPLKSLGQSSTSSSSSSSYALGGASADDSDHDDYHGVSRLETTRLMIQALRDLGFASSAAALEQESGCTIESHEVSEFRTAILAGHWTVAERILGALELKPGSDVIRLKFLIRQQKFLELLEQQQTMTAISVLHNELTPLRHDQHRLHDLSSLVMCSSADDIRQLAHWSGVDGDSRQELLANLQDHISPVIMIPDHRLATLLGQAAAYQELKCTYHNYAGRLSLYTDHICPRSELPTVTSQILSDHIGEVWFIAFSNDGTKLASASKDLTVIIWDIKTFEKIQVLKGHADHGVTSLAWSPDDQILITCGYDRCVKLWDVTTYECLETLDFQESVTSCAWASSGDEFLTGSLDMAKAISVYSATGRELHRLSGFRVYDLALTPDGKKIVAICNENRLRIYSRADYKLIAEIQLQAIMTCVTISKDSRYALVNISAKEIHLWDIEKIQLVRKCVGQQQKDFIIRSCFGGVADNFLVSGSDDANVYIWRRQDGMLIDVLPGHSKGVNSVAWNPVDQHMFASASDDNTIRIWTSDV